MDKKSLRALPSNHGLTCYKCKERPAELGKELHTPNGSSYWRGWCKVCVEGGVKHVKEVADRETKMNQAHKIQDRIQQTMSSGSLFVGKQVRLTADVMVLTIGADYVEFLVGERYSLQLSKRAINAGVIEFE